MKGTSALGPMLPTGARPNSGKAEPRDDTKNSDAATNRPPRRPMRCDSGPAIAPPITHPSRAQEIVQPERLCAAVSGRPRGLMKLASIAFTAPEMTAVSYPNSSPPRAAMTVSQLTRAKFVAAAGFTVVVCIAHGLLRLRVELFWAASFARQRRA